MLRQPCLITDIFWDVKWQVYLTRLLNFLLHIQKVYHKNLFAGILSLFNKSSILKVKFWFNVPCILFYISNFSCPKMKIRIHLWIVKYLHAICLWEGVRDGVVAKTSDHGPGGRWFGARPGTILKSCWASWCYSCPFN